MASIRRHGDKWRAEIFRNGQRASKVHRTKREAQDWAARQEYLIDTSVSAPRERMTLAEAADRYELEILPAKRARWNSKGSELFVLNLIRSDELGIKQIADISPQDLAQWRDRRLKTVSAASAQRYMNTLSSIFTAAEKDWGAVPENPMRKVRRPPPTPARKRRPTEEEIERLGVSGSDIRMSIGRAHQAFMFAIETGMRSHEIATLKWGNIDIEKRVARLDETKNGDARDVPLSKEAIKLLEQFEGMDPPFGFRSGAHLSGNWYALKEKAGIEGLTFHDSRHEAITRLSKKLDVLALARMVGHKNIKELMTYYNETAEELATRLD